MLKFSQNSIVKLQYTQERKQKLISNLDKGTWWKHFSSLQVTTS